MKKHNLVASRSMSPWLANEESVMHDDDETTSVEQDDWIAICQIIRADLLKRTERIKDYDLNQLQVLVNTCQTAMANEILSRLYDRKTNTFEV